MCCWNEFRLTDISDALRNQMCSVAAAAVAVAVTAIATAATATAVYSTFDGKM